jgi:hypothetical protein
MSNLAQGSLEGHRSMHLVNGKFIAINLSRLVILSMIFIFVGYVHAGKLKAERAVPHNLQKSKTTIEALVQIGPNSQAWKSTVVNTDPTKVIFRWDTEYELVGAAEWEISEDTQNWNVIARGNAYSGKNKQRTFSVDFSSIVGAKSHRPLKYYIRVVTLNLCQLGRYDNIFIAWSKSRIAHRHAY